MQINHILAKFCPWKLEVPLIITHRVVYIKPKKSVGWSVCLSVVPCNWPQFWADLDQIWCEVSFHPRDGHGHRVLQKKLGGGQGARRKCRDLHKRPYKKYREPWAATGIHHTVMEGQWHIFPYSALLYCSQWPSTKTLMKHFKLKAPNHLPLECLQ